MPDPNNASLITFQDWTLRIRESAPHEAQDESASRLLLLIHGLTGDENSMWVFAPDLPPHYWMVAPRAPHPSQMKQGGYSWLANPSKTEDRFHFEQLKPAAEDLLHLVDAYSQSVGLESRTFDMLGFSQGAAMASLLAFLYPERVGRTGILAGFVPAGLDGLVASRPLRGKPFFVAHGTRDERVSIERARMSIEILEGAGAEITYCEDDVGHKVSLNCLRALRKFLTD